MARIDKYLWSTKFQRGGWRDHDHDAKRDVLKLLCPFSLLSPAKSPKPPFNPAISPQAPNECVKYMSMDTVFVLDILGMQCVLVSRKWDLFRWRSFCGICFFCLDVGCRRRVVLRYRVNVCVKYMSMDTVCVCVLDILSMQLYRLWVCYLRSFLRTARWSSVWQVRFGWKQSFCGICLFCLDVGCRRRVVLRYQVNVCVKYMSMDTVCVLDILSMQLYRLWVCYLRSFLRTARWCSVWQVRFGWKW